MKALIFDVDDTLYDQLAPFEKALKEMGLQQLDIEKAYIDFRKYSDLVFEQTENGLLSLDDMRVYRIQEALKVQGVELVREEAMRLQQAYQYYQSRISLLEGMDQILNTCLENGIELGIITNGPTFHQWKKIEQLGLEKWVARNRILISEEIGVAKPQLEIFHMMESRLGAIEPEEICYVGDSYDNDVIGSLGASWQSIWFNHRHRECIGEVKSTYTIDTVGGLASLIGALIYRGK